MGRKEGSFRDSKIMESPTALPLPQCSVNARDSWALIEAAGNGHIEVVRYLMESQWGLPGLKK
jgi:hypothetical protein